MFQRERLDSLWADNRYLEIWFRLLVLAKWHDGLFSEMRL